MDQAVVAQIQKQLDQTIQHERVAIPLAVESGSRAWGFPSPDSDYDCRFIYVRSLKDYRSLFQKRDVIELPLTPVFDVNGWDIQKAIKLMLKGNAVILEWLQSPINYRKDQAFAALLLNLAEDIVDRAAVLDHYFYLLDSTMKRHFASGKTPDVKKLFYLLRPAMALRQLRLNSALSFPAMNLQRMIAASELDSMLSKIINELLAKKAVTRELGSVAAPLEVLTFVEQELELAALQRKPKKWLSVQRTATAEEAFEKILVKFAAT